MANHKIDIPKFKPPTSMNAADTMNHLSIDQLKLRQDSLMENIGALRFSIARIEYLEGMQNLFRDMLADARVVADAHGHKTLVSKIDRLLRETQPLPGAPK